MKAEHRKELQTNVLASQITKLVEGVKTKPNTRTYVIIGVVVVIVGLVIGWKIVSNRNKEKLSENWRKLYNASSPEAVAKIAKDAKGSEPARIAEFREARIELKKAIDALGTARDRAAAIKRVKEVGEMYERLAQTNKNMPVLVQEALFSAAKAKESVGDLDGAIAQYEKLAKEYPNSDAGKLATERADKIKKDRSEIQDFYGKLDEDPSKR